MNPLTSSQNYIKANDLTSEIVTKIKYQNSCSMASKQQALRNVMKIDLELTEN